jgi:hypothetical protein
MKMTKEFFDDLCELYQDLLDLLRVLVIVWRWVIQGIKVEVTQWFPFGG